MFRGLGGVNRTLRELEGQDQARMLLVLLDGGDIPS
jgi:hypothetical protein